MIQGGDGAISRVFSAVELRQYTLTQNKDVDFGSGCVGVSVLELETTKMVFSCRSTYTYLS